MILSYIDESGDDGFPKYSSPLFVLTTCYFDESFFIQNYKLVRQFRKDLKTKYNLPTGVELHMRELIQNKKPYTGIGLTKEYRKNIIDDIFDFISSPELKVRFINVVVDKTEIRNNNYPVLENTLKYLIRRIENDSVKSTKRRFICISDDGRVEIMNKTARKIRKIDYINSTNKPIELMIEDIFEKKSTESYFIQFCDCVSRIVNLYVMKNECSPEIKWSRKTTKIIDNKDVVGYLNKIKSKLNLEAAPDNDFGIKIVK